MNVDVQALFAFSSSAKSVLRVGENGVCNEFGVIASSINPLISDKLEVIVLYSWVS